MSPAEPRRRQAHEPDDALLQGRHHLFIISCILSIVITIIISIIITLITLITITIIRLTSS